MDTNTPVAQAPVAGALDGPITLFKFGWNLLIKHWGKLLIVMIVPMVIFVVGVLFIVTGSTITTVLGVLVMITGIAFSIASVPATIKIIHKVTVSPETLISIKEEYKFGFSVFWSFLLVSIIGGLVSAGSFTLLIIPGIFIAVCIITYKFSFIVDEKRGFSALIESFSLVRGRWWKVFGRVLFMILVVFVAYLINFGLSYLVGMLPTVLEIIFGIIVGFAFTVFYSSFSYAYLYRLYVSLKQSRATDVSTSTFRGWIIAFLCIGAILIPLAFLGAFSSIVLASLNVARGKAQDARLNAESKMAEIQRIMDEENLKMIQSGQTGLPSTQ